MEIDKSWIKLNRRRGKSNEFWDGMKAFVNMARPLANDRGMIRCPCKRCINMRLQLVDDVEVHIFRHGFWESYERWIYHGESEAKPVNFLAQNEGMCARDEMVKKNKVNQSKAKYSTLQGSKSFSAKLEGNMEIDKSWIKLNRRRRKSIEFSDGMKAFVNMARPLANDRGMIRCPCRRCINMGWQLVDDVEVHIFRHGFWESYDRWIYHGESEAEPVKLLAQNEGMYTRNEKEEKNRINWSKAKCRSLQGSKSFSAKLEGKMEIDKSWIKLNRTRGKSNEFWDGMKAFVNMVRPLANDRGMIRCPCRKCINMRWQLVDDVEVHIFRHGFWESYERWIYHGESEVEPVNLPAQNEGMCARYEMVEKNKVNRSKVIYPSLQGSKSFSTTRYERHDQGKLELHNVIDNFEPIHRKRKIGEWVNDRAASDYDQMTEVQNTQTQDVATSGMPVDEHAAIKQVLGERRGHIHGVGRIVKDLSLAFSSTGRSRVPLSISSFQTSAQAKARLDAQDERIRVLNKYIAHMTSSLQAYLPGIQLMPPPPLPASLTRSI